MSTSARVHYNHVTDAWKEFMGDNLHFGYFENGATDLPQATDLLVDKMLALCNVTSDSRVLDVGCGIGAPAFRIHEKCKCAIIGISTSERGIRLAAAASREKGYDDAVQFRVADGLDNGFPNDYFDIVWVMESSHLMADRQKLFRECFRVLRNDGVLVLCDLMLLKILPLHREIAHYLRHGFQYLQLFRTWGNGRVYSLGYCCNGLIQAGFHEVTAIDITEKTLPTLRWWRQNAVQHGSRLSGGFTKSDVDQFIIGCNILEKFFMSGMFGYGMLRAVK
ncbi:MAG: hypothetical protein A2176_01725 [Spirochaetes bacterium RBG_13_51_14]|nr:MAG: hypothetical protein A2176_01725 [Spirochaetes bacterium RBG_13_51_14]